jgi:hypothetical protein
VLIAVLAAAAETVHEAFPPPPGAHRLEESAFGAWLGELPLLPKGAPVVTWDGREVAMPAARVVDLPLPDRDVQQCADSILRLRATWERSFGRSPAFHYTSGDLSSWASWAAGTRPRVGKKVTFEPHAAAPDASDASFEAWLLDLFTYAGTRSLPLDTVPEVEPHAGDVVVSPGSPGHAVILLDVATDGTHTWVLAGQGYMPAMSFHVVSGPAGGWYPVAGDTLPTAPIPLPWSGLRRWRDP